MSTTKSWAYGGHQILSPSSGPVRLIEQRGRVIVVDPQAADIELRLPKTSEIAYTGYGVLLIVNVSMTNDCLIRNQSGSSTDVTVFGAAGTKVLANNMSRVSLTDRSTEDGKWLLRNAVINSAIGPPPDYIIMVGGVGSTPQERTRRFKINGESWDLSSDTSIDKKTPSCFRSGTAAYALRDQTDLDALDEYVVDTWTAKADSLENGGDDDAVATVLDKGIVYHDGAGNSPQVEEYDRTGNSWTGLNGINHPATNDTIINKTAARGYSNFAYLVWADTGAGTGAYVKEHNRTLDTWINIVEESSIHPNRSPALWLNNGSDLHQAGGDVDPAGSADDTDLHYKLDLIMKSAWVRDTDLPDEVIGAGAEAYTDDDTKALYAFGTYGDATDRCLRWDDVLDIFSTLSLPSDPDQFDVQSSVTTVPQ